MKLIGQLIGFLGIALFIASYQIFDKKKLLIVQSLATGAMALQYILIGAYSGFALDLICILRNIIYCNREKKYLSGRWIPYALAVIMAVVSSFSWDGYHSLFIIAGLMLNTVCLGVCDSQNLRKSILISCPLILTYDAVELSISGMINEGMSTISAIIGIVRYAQAKKQATI